MSAEKKKTVTFKAADKAKKKDIPTTVAPNAVAMGGMPDGTERSEATLAGHEIREAGVVDEQFATEALTKPDERDAMMAMKMELQDTAAAPGVTKFGVMVQSDEDLKWLQGKREQEAEANFQQWFATNFDRMSVTEKKLAREIWPEFYEQRRALLKKDIALAEKLVDLKLMGIQSADDLKLAYAAEAGFIDADRIHNLLHPEQAAANQSKQQRQANFVRGLFSPRRLPRGDWGPNDRETNAISLLGRTATTVGNAHKLGTTGHGFSAIGPTTSSEEMQSSFARQYATMEQFQ